MSTTTVTVNANTSPAINNLKKLQKQVQNTNDGFNKLSGLLKGLAIGTFITSIIRSADAIDELSKATGIGIAEINGLSSAMIANGGDAEVASKAVTVFAQSIDEAAQGSAKTQYQFEQLGISLNDLRNLSESDLLRKTIDGLSKMPAGAQRTAVALDLLGKGVRTVDFDGLNKDLDGFITKSKAAEPGIKNAAELFGNIQNIIKAFGTELTKSSSGLTEFLVEITKNTEAIAKALVDLTKIVASAAAAFLIFGKVIPAVTKGMTLLQTILTATTSGGFAKLAQGIKTSFIAMKNFDGKITQAAVAAGQAVTKFTKLKQVLFSLSAIFANMLKILLRFGGIVGILFTVAQAVDFLTKRFLNFSVLEWVGKKFEFAIGKVKEFLRYIGLMDESVEASNNAMSKGPQGPRRLGDEQRQQLREVAKANQALAASIQEVTRKYKDQNDQIVENLNLEKLYMNLSEENIDIAKAQRDVYDRAIESITELQNKKAQLKPEEQAYAAEIDKQIKIIEDSIAVDQERASKAISNLYAMRQAQEDFNRSLEDTARELEKASTLADLQEELNLIGLYGDELEKQTRLNEINRNLRQEQQQLAIELLRLEKDRNRIGEATYAAERQRIVKQMADAVELSEARIAAFEEEQKRKTELEGSYAEGAKRALIDIADQFKPINIAQDAVKKGFDAIGNAIDDFVETGKFSFKSFAASVIADLSKIIAKALILQAIKSIFGNFGIPGLATGGPAKAGQPYIVGEKGPELFVPKTSGTVVPNDAMKNGVATGAVNAPVTNNYNTYNINAVDAKSVAQLFAENRRTLLGSVRMAERELPYMA